MEAQTNRHTIDDFMEAQGRGGWLGEEERGEEEGGEKGMGRKKGGGVDT